MQFTYYGGGFSASGGTRVVNLGSAPAALTWGSPNFLPSGAALVLSSPSSNSMVDFQNPINHQLSYSHHGKSRTENIRPEHINAVTSQIANHRKLRDLIDQWIDTAIELDRLRRSPAR